ncbi:thioredoxin reductase 1, cytoplasmic-like [Folsomia candida]|nr:thioredoxin reductase 1, cytoplasmic-like [Folsomia candida]
MIGWTPVEILCEERSGSHLKKKLTLCAKHVQTGERSNKDFDTIILAIGRKPATRLLNLKNAEVLIEDDTHKIWVDSQDMTTTEDVFALGDCASQRLSTPSTLINFNGVAYQAGLNLSKRLYHGHIDSMEYDQVLPRFLLTYPHSYACVGLSEEDAVIEHGETNIDVYHSRSIPLQYQLGNRYKTVCYAKMITLKSEDERIVGLHYLGPNAGDVMQGYVLALKLKARKVDMDSMINIHPTSAEIFSRMSKTFEESDLVLNSTC